MGGWGGLFSATPLRGPRMGKGGEKGAFLLEVGGESSFAAGTPHRGHPVPRPTPISRAPLR